jgi:hypothetical protein
LGSKEEQDKGWFRGAWDGVKRVWTDGRSDLYLSGWYWHTPWGFSAEKRSEYNNWGLGVGIGRTLTDAKGCLNCHENDKKKASTPAAAGGPPKLDRRDLLRGLSTVPALGLFGYAWTRQQAAHDGTYFIYESPEGT